VVVGSGYIALEFACLLRGLGAEVDLVYRQQLPLRGMDGDLREAMAEALLTMRGPVLDRAMVTRYVRVTDADYAAIRAMTCRFLTQ
jgi:pyruvate/2-oxoglutarate dehydrogenase complex dihydrolipoamide dehydrogenase (E3) component